MNGMIRMCYGLLSVALTMSGPSPAWAVKQDECLTQGFESVVAPYQHLQPLYDGTHHLDVYLPSSTTMPAPLIVYVHGGGWSGTNWRFECRTGLWVVNRLAEGFAIASVEYSEAQTPPATIGGTADNVIRQVRQIKHAIKWLKSQKTDYNLDDTKTVITGGSAGGHLSALTALTEGESLYDPVVPASLIPISSAVQFVFTYAGVYDIGTYSDPWLLVPQVFGCWRPSLPSWRPCSSQTISQASPVAHIDASDPKVYVLHGDHDAVVPPQQADEMRTFLCAAGKLSYYNLAISGGGIEYQHNLEPFIAANPYQGLIVRAGLSDDIPSNCPPGCGS